MEEEFLFKSLYLDVVVANLASSGSRDRTNLLSCWRRSWIGLYSCNLLY